MINKLCYLTMKTGHFRHVPLFKSIKLREISLFTILIYLTNAKKSVSHEGT